MRRAVLAAALALLAGCGVDGPPVPPSGHAAVAVEPGVTVTGEARIGMQGGW